MIKKLPINEPLITTSPTLAALFSIITGEKFLNSWIINHFNNILFIKNDEEERCIFFEDQPNYRSIILEEVDFLRFSTMKYDLVNIFKEDIIQFIIQAINLGYYVRMAVDNFYLHLNKKTYGQKHLLHPLFVYGYDTEQHCLLIGEFFNQQKFNFYKIDFDEFLISYEKCNYSESNLYEYLQNIVLIKLNRNYREEIDLSIVLDGINDYLAGEDRTMKYLYPHRKKGSHFFYGIQCYECILNSIRNRNYDLRSCHVLYDRMKLHSFKLEGFYSSGILGKENYKKFAKYTEYLMKLSISNRNLLLKIYLQNKEISNNDMKIIELKYLELKEFEKNYLLLLKEQLKKLINSKKNI